MSRICRTAANIAHSVQAGPKASPIQIVLSGAGRKLSSRVASIDHEDIET